MIDAYWRRAAVKRVVDGDTVVFLIDLGFRMYSEHSCRVLDVNTPELYGSQATPEGSLAKEFTASWLHNHVHAAVAPPWPFQIKTEKADSFGRYLAKVECSQGHDLAADLVSSGHGKPYKV